MPGLKHSSIAHYAHADRELPDTLSMTGNTRRCPTVLSEKPASPCTFCVLVFRRCRGQNVVLALLKSPERLMRILDRWKGRKRQRKEQSAEENGTGRARAWRLLACLCMNGKQARCTMAFSTEGTGYQWQAPGPRSRVHLTGSKITVTCLRWSIFILSAFVWLC